MAKSVTVGDKYSQEEVDRALRMLERQREQSKKWRERMQTPEAKEKQRINNLRRRITNQLLLAKAKKQGITVSSAELEAALKAAGASKAKK
jgi:hypothetical protein